MQVIHGLDQVIYYYRRNPNTGLQHSLGDFIEGELCPNALRLHGSENLLHRATAEGNAIVVSELLNCGYRNLSAKNHDGQSAVHLGICNPISIFICRFPTLPWSARFNRNDTLQPVSTGTSKY